MKRLSAYNTSERGKKIRICFLSTVSPFDHRGWSGICFHVYNRLSKDHDVFWSGKPVFSMFIRVKLRIWKLLQLWVGRKYTDQNELNAKLLSKWTKCLLAKSSADIIMVGAGEPETFAYLDTSIPIVYLADSTFHLKLDYYPWHTGLSKGFIVQGEEIERRALQRSAHICYSSFWAKRSAMEYYGIGTDKISVHPMGPNLDRVPGSLHKKNDDEVLNLLFIGIN